MVTTSMPTVWMIDPSGDKRGTIRYTKCVGVGRFLDFGTWRVECALTAKHVRAAAAGWRVIIDDRSGLFGGDVHEAEIVLADDGQRREQRLVLSGVDDMWWLNKSLAWPLPTAGISSQTQAYDVREGVASTVLIAYLAANRGPTATDETRRIPGLTLATDPEIGDEVIGRARFTNLLELQTGLAISGGVGFRMVPNVGRSRTFEVYEPPNLLGPARFGLALGNVRSVKWRISGPEATDVVGGGRGEEEARDFIKLTNLTEAADWGRVEDFYDYRSAADDDGGAELLAGSRRRLDEQAATRMVEIQPIDNARLRYGLDYQLGSRVAVDVYGGIFVEAIIREVELSVTRSAGQPVRTLMPRVGDLGASSSSATVMAIRDALARVANLERNR